MLTPALARLFAQLSRTPNLPQAGQELLNELELLSSVQQRTTGSVSVADMFFIDTPSGTGGSSVGGHGFQCPKRDQCGLLGPN